MEKVRAATIQQKLGFKDDDLKTPKHDEIVLWVSGHALDIVTAIWGTRAQWTPEQICELNASLEEAYQPVERVIMTDLPVRNPISVDKVKWEVPIMSDKYVVGFVDLMLKWSWDEVTIDTGGGWAISHPNAKVTWEVKRFSQVVCIEAKSSIPSLGELVRQIRLYEQYCEKPYVVVSPDARYADVLKSQGIEFYHYEEDPYEEAMR